MLHFLETNPDWDEREVRRDPRRARQLSSEAGANMQSLLKYKLGVVFIRSVKEDFFRSKGRRGLLKQS